MVVPFFGVQRENQAREWEYLQVIQQVMASGRMLQGYRVATLENELHDLFDREVVCVGSCTDALFFAIKSLKLLEGCRILVPAFSFVATASSVVRAGHVPVFMDVDDAGNMDFQSISDWEAKRASAIVIVHLYGQMLDPETVIAFSDRLQIPVIEDAAQAFGATYLGMAAGQLGTISCLSFDPTKNLAAFGSGGAILTEDRFCMEAYRYHGKQDGQYLGLGWNSQLPEISAAILCAKLAHFGADQACRRDIAKLYLEGLYKVPIKLPQPMGEPSWHKFVIRSQERDALKEFLLCSGIEVKVHYSQPLSSLPVFAQYARDCPKAEKLASEVLSLPIHPFLSDVEVEEVVGAIVRFYEG